LNSDCKHNNADQLLCYFVLAMLRRWNRLSETDQWRSTHCKFIYSAFLPLSRTTPITFTKKTYHAYIKVRKHCLMPDASKNGRFFVFLSFDIVFMILQLVVSYTISLVNSDCRYGLVKVKIKMICDFILYTNFIADGCISFVSATLTKSSLNSDSSHTVSLGTKCYMDFHNSTQKYKRLINILNGPCCRWFILVKVQSLCYY
jgi:hypothetical protein